MSIPHRGGVSRLRAETDPLDHWKLVDVLSEIVNTVRSFQAGEIGSVVALGAIKLTLDDEGLLDDEEEDGDE